MLNHKVPISEEIAVLGVNDDEKHIRIACKFFVQQTNKIEHRKALVNRQRTTNPNYARLFPGCGRNLGDHCLLEG